MIIFDRKINYFYGQLSRAMLNYQRLSPAIPSHPFFARNSPKAACQHVSIGRLPWLFVVLKDGQDVQATGFHIPSGHG